MKNGAAEMMPPKETETTAQRWDAAAKDYQRVFRTGQNDYNRRLLEFWQRKGMLRPGGRVLDIGCGVGKYGVMLAAYGCDVTLTDISPEMLRHAEENMSGFPTPWAVWCGDFDEVSGKEPVFSEGFDLTISTMSPAVHDAETVRKMSGMTRGWCFLSRFCDWEQPLRDTLMRAAGIGPRRRFGNLQEDCDALMGAVRDAGYEPRTEIVDYCWSDERTPEEMADYMCRNYLTEEEDRDCLTETVRRETERMAGSRGKVDDAVNTKVVWIWWKA